MEQAGLDPDELEDFNKLISGTMIPGIIKIADKYNIDRNSLIKFTADMLETMAEIATFENYKADWDKE